MIKTSKEFLSKWLLDFRWLFYDKDENAMFCNWRRLFPDHKNAFTKGCKNFQRSVLDEHVITNDHVKSAKKSDTLIQGMIGTLNDHKSVTGIIQSQKEKLKYQLLLPLFRNIYRVAKEDVALLKVESQFNGSSWR